jgi:hypothetical protein
MNRFARPSRVRQVRRERLVASGAKSDRSASREPLCDDSVRERIPDFQPDDLIGGTANEKRSDGNGRNGTLK